MQKGTFCNINIVKKKKDCREATLRPPDKMALQQQNRYNR